MLRRPVRRRRRGVTVLEGAIAYPVVFLLTLGLIVGGLGVFRYEELAHLAREGSRYASVHGTKYAGVTGKSAATADDVYNNAVLPGAVILDKNSLGHTVTWSPDNKPGSSVTVKLTYSWVPEAFLG